MKDMHELRFSNISVLSHIVCYIPPLTLIVVFAIKAVGLSRVRQAFSNIFAMYYGDINKNIFLFRFFYYFRLKMYYFVIEEMKRKTQKQ